MKNFILYFICLLLAINCFSMEEKREIFATNIQNYIQTNVFLPGNTENFVSSTKTDVVILFQGVNYKDISKLKQKYGLTEDMASQILAAKYASGSNIYSKLQESIYLGTGEIKESIGAAIRDGDMIYFAMIRGLTSATLRTKYENVCHEECDTVLIFFEDCDTICNDIPTAYTASEIDLIKQYIKYYSVQALLKYIEILKQPGYQAYFTDGNAIYSEDGKYLLFVTDFGDLALGPVKDIAVVSRVGSLELIDDGTRVTTTRGSGTGGVTFGGRRLAGTMNHGTLSPRNGGSSNYSGEGTIVTVPRVFPSTSLFPKKCCFENGVAKDTGGFYAGRRLEGNFSGRRSSTGNSNCVNYYDGNFQLFNFIGEGVSGSLSKEEVLKRMLEGRKKGEYYLLITNDGNMEIKNGETIIWQTNTANQGVFPYDLKVYNDRYFTLEDSNGKQLYKSGIIKEYNILKRSYCGNTSKHDAVINTVITNSCTEETKWKTLPEQENNTKEIFRCMVGSERENEYMVSVDPNCENQSNVGSLGWIYINELPDTVPIYRCRNSDDHFISNSSDCEGNIKESLLGYAYPA